MVMPRMPSGAGKRGHSSEPSRSRTSSSARGPPALHTCAGSPPRKNRPSAMPGTSGFIRKFTGPGA